MKFAVIDTETTGFGRKDEVIQFACVLADENFKALRTYNAYCYTQHPISSGALEVHHIDKDLLMELSGGKVFEDVVEDMNDLFSDKDITWVEWSSNGFDMRMINQTLMNNGAKPINFGQRVGSLNRSCGVYNYNLLHGVCNLLFNGRPAKLHQAVATLPYSLEQIDKMYNSYVSLGSEDSAHFHAADYDAFTTWLLLYTYGNRLRL